MRMLMIGLFLIISLDTLRAQTSVSVTNLVNMELLDAVHHLGPGDKVTYRVIEDEDEPRSLTIGDSGDLDVPYYGLVQAAGKSSRDLAKQIKSLLERDLYHQATVIVAVELINKTRTIGNVYLAGQLRNPGNIEIPANEIFTVSKAILKAGGFSDFADKKGVRIIRNAGGKEKALMVNVAEVWEKGRVEKDLVLQPNDFIFVPARLVNF